MGETSLSMRELRYQGAEGSERVLIVDDEEVMRVILQAALGDEFSIALCASAEEAIEYLSQSPPDVMLIDKNLPGMSGIELLQEAKKIHPESEAIIITGYASLESAIEALRLGAYDYLVKPFGNIMLVIEKVRRAMERKRLTSERHRLMKQIIASNHQLRMAHDRLRKSYLQTLTSMITALEARDPYTRGHSDRVAHYTALIGKKLGFHGQEFKDLVDGARLHDLGKIGIREQILNKNGELTQDEYRHIKIHPDIGADIIGKIEAYRHLVPMIRHHHERFDGTGYPDGLKGESIPLSARIIAVADAYDAMTSHRPYRNMRSCDEAIRIIEDFSGSRMDPKIVTIFVEIQRELHQTE